jgi:hypothetical protein
MSLFKRLSAAEEADYRRWAREHYRPLDPIDGTWHPVVQDECRLINEQFYEPES